jgi:hypothetical protein
MCRGSSTRLETLFSPDKACHILDGYTDVGLHDSWNRGWANTPLNQEPVPAGDPALAVFWMQANQSHHFPAVEIKYGYPPFTTICEATVIINTVVTVTYPGTAFQEIQAMGGELAS